MGSAAMPTPQNIFELSVHIILKLNVKMMAALPLQEEMHSQQMYPSHFEGLH